MGLSVTLWMSLRVVSVYVYMDMDVYMCVCSISERSSTSSIKRFAKVIRGSADCNRK